MKILMILTLVFCASISNTKAYAEHVKTIKCYAHESINSEDITDVILDVESLALGTSEGKLLGETNNWSIYVSRDYFTIKLKIKNKLTGSYIESEGSLSKSGSPSRVLARLSMSSKEYDFFGSVSCSYID